MIEFVGQSTVNLVQANASDDMVCMAAWVSQDRDSEDRLSNVDRKQGLINFLYKNRHMSPFEHGQFTFKVDVPLFVAREFQRHRTFSYNEVSGRYTTMKPRFYVIDDHRPVVQEGKVGNYTFTTNREVAHQAVLTQKELSTIAWTHYTYLKDAGVANEVARMHLPLNLMTQFYATVNPRNLMHFLDLRNDEQALYEIRAVAEQMESHLKQQMPLTYNAYKEN